MTADYVVDYVPVFRDMEERIAALGLTINRFCSENGLKSSNFYNYRDEEILFKRGVKATTIRRYLDALERLEAEYAHYCGGTGDAL